MTNEKEYSEKERDAILRENKKQLRREALAREKKLIENVGDVAMAIRDLQPEPESRSFAGFPRAAEILYDLTHDVETHGYVNRSDFFLIVGAARAVRELVDHADKLVKHHLTDPGLRDFYLKEIQTED